jgi:hypothetical protein
MLKGESSISRAPKLLVDDLMRSDKGKGIQKLPKIFFILFLEQASIQGCNQFYIGLFHNGNTWAWYNGDSSNYQNWKTGK